MPSTTCLKKDLSIDTILDRWTDPLRGKIPQNIENALFIIALELFFCPKI
jgi:hypothetical protein